MDLLILISFEAPNSTNYLQITIAFNSWRHQRSIIGVVDIVERTRPPDYRQTNHTKIVLGKIHFVDHSFLFFDTGNRGWFLNSLTLFFSLIKRKCIYEKEK